MLAAVSAPLLLAYYNPIPYSPRITGRGVEVHGRAGVLPAHEHLLVPKAEPGLAV